MKHWLGTAAVVLIVSLGTIVQTWLWSWFPSIGVCAALSYFAGRAITQNERKSGWEEHPCVMPKIEEPLGAKGQVWACRCGRRWKFLREEREPYRLNGKFHVWEEWTPEKALAEAEKDLKKLTIKGTPLPSTLDAIERDR